MSIQVLYASFAVQAAGAILAALIFGRAAREHRKSFLAHWARSWGALAAVIACAWLQHATASIAADSRPLAFTLATLGGTAGFLQIVWMASGAYELAVCSVITPSIRRLNAITAFVAALAVSIAIIVVPRRDGLGEAVSIGVHALLLGVALAAAALVIWHAATRPAESDATDSGAHRRPVGERIVALTFALYAAAQLWTVVAAWRLAVTGAHPPFLFFRGFFDFVVTFTSSLGVVIWLLEEERHAARDFADRIEELAYHDALTGLPNRQLFLDHLSLAIPAARRGHHKLAVFFFDLDRFKIINDSLGHSVGDKLLQIVAQRVRHTLRDTDTVARMGGDEFTILAPVINTVDDAAHVALKVQEAIRHPIRIEGRELFVTASLGVSMWPDDGEQPETLLKNADAAMYRAKARGVELFQLYTPEMNLQALEQLALESAMRRATAVGEFEVYYQPIVGMSDGRVQSMEAVLRWRHPELGFLRPPQFLGLAETTGMIVPIGEWALREACRQLAAWRADHPSLRIAVNVSRRQLLQNDFVALVERVLTEHGLSATALELEVSETCAAQCDESAIERLRGLRALGVRIAIDDVGTGYSSLARLRNFPVDALKIDTTFVRDLVSSSRDAEVAAAVIAMGRALRLAVVAEGVENPAQLEFLRHQECESWQGYLCCPPVAAGEATVVLARVAAR